MRPNPTAPHTIILTIKAEVREVLPTGEISGNIAHRHKEGQHEFFKLEAGDRDLAIIRLNETLDRLRKEGFKNG